MNKKSFYFTTAYYKNSIDVFVSRPFLCVIIFLLLFPLLGSAQVGINTPIDADGSPIIDSSAVLQIDSNDKGVLFPRLNKIERDLINTTAAALDPPLEVPAGLTIYCTDCCDSRTTGSVYYYNGVEWKSIDSKCIE